MTEQLIEQKIKEIKACPHEFKDLAPIERGFTFLGKKFVTSTQYYAVCKKCKVTLHKNDGDLSFVLNGLYIQLKEKIK